MGQKLEKWDVAVIGAGVVGLSLSRRLAAAGVRCVVLDPLPQGGRGSRAAAGVAVPSVRHADDPEMMRFCQEAQRRLAAELEKLPDGAALRRGQGVLRAMPTPEARDQLAAKAKLFPEILGRWIGNDELVALEPALGGTQLPGAFYDETGFIIDVEGYLNTLLAQAGRAGVTFLAGESARSIREESGQVHVRHDSGELTADRVVVCAGAWSGNLAGLAPQPITPMRGQLMTLFHPTLRVNRVLSGAMYLAPWRNGQVVVGATEEHAGFVQATTAAGLMQLTATVARVAPALRDAEVLTTWSGLRSAGPRHRPAIGRYPGTDRVFLGTAHGGQGILSGAFTADLLLELLSTGKSAQAEPFAPEGTLAPLPG